MLFKLTEEQTTRFLDWRKRQVEKGRNQEGGSRFTFCFSPGFNGMKVKVIDRATNEEIDLN